MREIKFRVWDKNLKEMNYDDIEDIGQDDYWYDGETEVWNVLHDANTGQERFILMQYTGLKDNNGKEIYEGDVLRLWRSISKNGIKRGGYYKPLIVKYCDTWCQFVVEDYSTKDKYGVWQQFGAFEVIGNIYENPELLEVT